MSLLRRYIFSQIAILSLLLSIYGQTENKTKVNLSDMTEEQLILMLSSANDEDSTQAAIEIFKRGEKIIPQLLKLRGNKTVYVGYCLGDPLGADTTRLIERNADDGSVVKVEVAALYLITAIYYDNLAFANVPYLRGKKPVRDFRYNTAKRVKQAWEAMEKWYKKLEEKGLQNLREANEFPLKSTEVRFIGTNPRRERKLSDCIL